MEQMPNSNSNADALPSASHDHKPMLCDAYFVRKSAYFMWHYFVNTPCFLFHELCHFLTLFALYPFLRVNKIESTLVYKFGLWNYSIIVDFGSKYKLVRFLVIVAPLLGSMSLYVLFILKTPILSLLVLFLIHFSKLGLSKIDKNSLRELFF